MSGNEEKPYGGFDDEYEFYLIGDRKLKINQLNYNQTKEIKAVVKEYEKAVKQFTAKEITDSERIDKQDELIEKTLSLALSSEDFQSLLNDNNIAKPTLFRISRDLYTFLQVIGNKAELRHWQTLSSSTTPKTSASLKDSTNSS